MVKPSVRKIISGLLVVLFLTALAAVPAGAVQASSDISIAVKAVHIASLRARGEPGKLALLKDSKQLASLLLGNLSFLKLFQNHLS